MRDVFARDGDYLLDADVGVVRELVCEEEHRADNGLKQDIYVETEDAIHVPEGEQSLTLKLPNAA